jgi:FMN phosphatase YigB (HAD superfamily)
MPQQLSEPVKVLGFDLGNTLINDTMLAQTSIKDMGNWLFKNDHVPSVEDFISTYKAINYSTKKSFISRTFGELEFFEKTFEKLDVNTISATVSLEKYRKIVNQKIHQDPDIVETFEFIKERNLKIALMSNERTCRVDAYLEKTKLKPFFDAVIVSESIGIEKPELGFFETALNLLNIKGSQMILFGDNEIADGAGKQLGIFFVLVTAYKHQDWFFEDGNPYRPDHVMNKITKKNMEAFLRTVPH